jgi:heat shock protein HslJ
MKKNTRHNISNWLIILLSSCAAILPLTSIAPAMTQQTTPENEVTSSIYADQLEKKTWQLVRWQSNNQNLPLIPLNPITIKFDGRQLGGSTGCNSYSSGYQLQNNRLRLVGDIISTMIGCAAPVAERERAFLSALKSVKTITINNQDRLVIRYETSSSRGTMIFAASDVKLQNTSWQLNAISTNSNKVPVTITPPVTLRFTDNSVNGFAGCNNYNGAYQQQQNRLTISRIVSTKKGCAPPQTRIEQEFLAALSNVQRYEVAKNGELRLSNQNQSKTLILTPLSRPR